MEGSAFVSALILLASFIVKDLYLNSLDSATSHVTTEGEAEKIIIDDDDFLDIDDLSRKLRSNQQHEMKDNFFDEDDVDIKSHMEDRKAGGGPGSRISSAKFTGPTIKFLYCSTSGYRNAFDQFVAIIQEKHPELYVEGEQYPADPYKRLGGQIINIIKFLILGSIIASQYSILHKLGVPVVVTNWMAQNKVYAGLLLFFVFNFLESQLVATGAFEIFVDDVPIWSKLQTGRVPSPPELVQIIENQLKMGGRESVLDGFKM